MDFETIEYFYEFSIWTIFLNKKIENVFVYTKKIKMVYLGVQI